MDHRVIDHTVIDQRKLDFLIFSVKKALYVILIKFEIWARRRRRFRNGMVIRSDFCVIWTTFHWFIGKKKKKESLYNKVLFFTRPQLCSSFPSNRIWIQFPGIPAWRSMLVEHARRRESCKSPAQTPQQGGQSSFCTPESCPPLPM